MKLELERSSMKTRKPVCPECLFEVELSNLTDEWWCEACGERGELDYDEPDSDEHDDYGDRD